MATTDSKFADLHISWPPTLMEKLPKFSNLYAGICTSSWSCHNMPGYWHNLSNRTYILTVVADVHRGGGIVTTNEDKCGEGAGGVNFSRFYADILCGWPLNTNVTEFHYKHTVLMRNWGRNVSVQCSVLHRFMAPMCLLEQRATFLVQWHNFLSSWCHQWLKYISAVTAIVNESSSPWSLVSGCCLRKSEYKFC